MKNYFWSIESWGSEHPAENADEIIDRANELIEAYAEEHDEEETAAYSEKLWERYCSGERIDKAYFEAAVNLMDDEIREEIHNSFDYYGDEVGFLDEYKRRHEEKYGEEFIIN